ncbi:MAG TPA: MmgE/PrpD family protein [Candidatus Caldiarchaeum subterraneum]|uniref:MmgE/PrpD family protein n=1 Tax=Caldiarchaeum subterraneum TaxID=311458 RepID=A0A832ZWZ5_CALS0|nr:MmgE/PrpD family protein [Candidatus Caldarchaeum subterraneum]
MAGRLLAEKFAEFAASLKFSQIPKEVVDEAKRRVLDTLGVSVGAFNAPPSVIARKVAARFPARDGASVILEKVKTTPDWAAFVNGVMARYLDFNDTYLSKEALHPSDIIPALVAACEITGTGGKRLVEGIVAGYEAVCRLADAASIRDRGWDHVAYIAIGASVGAGKVMGLDEEKLTHAINIATVASAALRQTRAGELSMWKGCAAANAARHGLFASLLARQGMTGPSPIFEGEMGFWKQVSGEFTIEELGEKRYKILETSIKNWPVEYHSMSAVEAALRLREKINGKVDEIEFIKVETFTVSHKIIVKDPEKWNPRTRETADHSLPYITARALLDGFIWIESFKNDKIMAEDVRGLMRNMTIEVNPEYDNLYPEAVPNKLVVKLRDGRLYEEEVIYPKGHYRNPLTDEELHSKFMKLASKPLGRKRAEQVIKLVQELEKIKQITRLTRLLSKR